MEKYLELIANTIIKIKFKNISIMYHYMVCCQLKIEYTWK